MHKSWIIISACLILLSNGVLLLYCGINKVHNPAVSFICSIVIILCTIFLAIFNNRRINFNLHADSLIIGVHKHRRISFRKKCIL